MRAPRSKAWTVRLDGCRSADGRWFTGCGRIGGAWYLFDDFEE